MLPPTRRPSPTAEKRVRSWSWQGTPQERGRVRRWKRTARRRHPGPEDRPEAPETDCGPAHRLRATQSRPTNAEVRRRMSPLGAGFLRAMRDPASAVLRQNRPTSRAPQDARTPLPGTSRCAQSAGGVVSALHMARLPDIARGNDNAVEAGHTPRVATAEERGRGEPSCGAGGRIRWLRARLPGSG